MSQSDKSYRIRTKVGENAVLQVPFKQDVDFLEILSLKISQQSLYKLHTSKYGVVVGRVLANDGFGVPNAKLSIFIKLSEEDGSNSDITQYYPFYTISSTDNKNRRYNLLPDDKNNDCYRIVGTFPNKRLVLDNDNQIEIFDKYWKYTTTTNQSGDYMLFGVPTGVQTLHVDVDLSNIGVLSQKPRDFFYKGYSETLFDNASQFKESTNLDNLAQIFGQNQSITVYPFWGDKDAEGEIAISRADINLAYKFETTCVFMGGLITDDPNHPIGYNCDSNKKIGYNRSLSASEGTIEMIRKTHDGLIEEVQINGNKLIDGDGVWCYQIPMNLDYVVTDEFGNLVPTDNPNKGIPTRTSVRFRISITETGEEGFSRHRAEYLVPNNPMPTNETGTSTKPKYSGKKWDSISQYYDFGSATIDDCFRDLYWNKVYSVKNYIPRIQTNTNTKTNKYTGIRTTNYNESILPAPFNNVRLSFPFSYTFICILMQVFFVIIAMINALLSFLRIIVIGIPGLKIFGIKLYWYPFDFIQCIHIEMEDDEKGDGSTIVYAPGCWGRPGKGWKIGDMGGFSNRMQRGLAQDNEVANFDFYNDWLNGSLYMPFWFWRKTKKKKYFFGLFSKDAQSIYCSATSSPKRVYLAQGCPVKVDNSEQFKKNVQNELSTIPLKYGIIYEKTNKDGFKIYYYAPITIANTSTSTSEYDYIRLFATDIILLGSFSDCDIDGMPKAFEQIPSTTSNVPPMVSALDSSSDNMMDDSSIVAMTGLDWMKEGNAPKKTARGLLFDLGCVSAKTYHKSIINTRRLCELGVSLDSTRVVAIPNDNGITYKQYEPDGLITRYEVDNSDVRAMFASLNSNGLNNLIYNPSTQYTTYRLDYLYPISFDGAMDSVAPSYTSNKTTDIVSNSYLKYRFGSSTRYWQYNDKMPMYNNSFYFYFGTKPGKTAMERFFGKFYAECFENKQEPFTISVVETPGEWCEQNASVELGFDRIRSPYSIEVLDSIGYSLFTASNLTLEKVKIEYPDDETTGSESNDEATASAISDENNEEDVAKIDGDGVKISVSNIDDDKYYLIESENFTNGIYTLIVKDSYGREMSTTLDLMQSPLGLDIETTNLSAQYEVGKLVENELCGKIKIKSVSIDGANYYFTDRGSKKGIGEYEFEVKLGTITGVTTDDDTQKDKIVINDSSNKKITLSIKQQNESNDPSINTFDDTLTEKQIKLMDFSLDADGVESEKARYLQFNIGTADSFDISSILYCDNELSDNEFNTTVSITSSEKLALLLDGVDISVLKTIPSEGREDAEIKRSVNINNPNQYNFPEYNETNQSWWDTYVNGLVGVNGGENEETSNDYLENDYVKIAAYKLNAIFKFAQAVYAEKNQGTIKFSSKGGSDPVIYTAFPRYNDVSQTNTSTSKLQSYEFSDTTTTIQTVGNYPLLINGNYYYKTSNNPGTNNNLINSLSDSYVKNPIFKLEKLGNYGGVIDNNVPNNKSTVPNGIKQFTSGIYTSMDDNDNDLGNYLNLYTVDKRVDYSLVLFKKQIENGVTNVTIDKNSSYIFGGVALKYDEEYNIVSSSSESDKKLEYYYNKENGNIELNNCNDRQYYSISFRTDTSIFPNGTNTSDSNSRTLQLKDWFIEDASSSTQVFPIFKLDPSKDLAYNGITSFSWSIVPCSYNMDASVLNGDISCVVNEGDESEGNLSLLSSFGSSFNDVRTAADKEYWNVKYKKNKTRNVSGIFLEYAIREDTSTSCSVYTSAPVFVQKTDGSDVTLQEIMDAYKNNSRFLKFIINEDYKDTYTLVNISGTQSNEKYPALTDNKNVRCADDSEVRTAITYSLDTNSARLSAGLTYHICVKREYVDSMFNVSRLDRKVTVYEAGKTIKYDEVYKAFENIVFYVSQKKLWNNKVPLKSCPQCKLENKFCFIRIEGASFNTSDMTSVENEDGTVSMVPQIVVKIGKETYSDVYPVGNESDRQYVIPFYSTNLPSDDDDVDDDDTDYVAPVWYKGGKTANIYIKKGDLIHRFEIQLKKMTKE